MGLIIFLVIGLMATGIRFFMKRSFIKNLVDLNSEQFKEFVSGGQSIYISRGKKYRIFYVKCSILNMKKEQEKTIFLKNSGYINGEYSVSENNGQISLIRKKQR